jgi:hypothetical protein
MIESFNDPATGARIVSIEEANALVPKLKELVGAQLELGDEIQRLVTQLYTQVGPASTEDGAEMVDVTVYPEDDDHIRRLKTSLASAAQSYKRGWNEVQELGAVVKDTTTGLLDFYGKIDDRLVWLCWRYGEDSIAYYHELDAGFAGRKPLSAVKNRMLN